MLKKEIHVWSNLHHQNILQLLGYAVCEDTEYPMLISEWMYGGSAWIYVHNHPELPIRERVRLVRFSSLSRAEAI